MSVVNVTVKVAGRAVAQELPLVSVDVRRALNRLPSAMLVYNDGDLASGEFPISDSAQFKHGAEVEILARYEGDNGPGATDRVLFKGVVVRHGIESGAHGTVLRLDLRDKAVAMTRPRRSRVSVDAKDSDVFAKLVAEAGLSADMEATTAVHKSLVQFDCSDWDWLVTRAEALGQVVVVNDGKVRATRPNDATAPKLMVEWGSSIRDMVFECDAMGQELGVEATSWDADTQKMADAQGTRPPKPAQGALGGDAAARALGFKKSTLVFPGALLPAEAKDWATAEAARSQWGLLRGRVSVQGVGTVGLLDVVEIKSVAKAFTGRAVVTGLCHRIADGDWQTDLQFGLAPEPHHRRPDIARAPAAGLLPPASGLQTGVVEAVSEDPLKQHRIKVKLPAMGETADGLWARLAAPDAGNARGWNFRPEPGDEVVVGFFNDDPRQPVVLGALFGSKHAPPEAVHDTSDKNTLRGLVTRSGLTLALDDEKKQLSLLTPSGAKLLLDDEGEAIVLSDKHGNTITLDKNGVCIKSAKDFKVEASGNVVIKGSKIDLN